MLQMLNGRQISHPQSASVRPTEGNLARRATLSGRIDRRTEPHGDILDSTCSRDGHSPKLWQRMAEIRRETLKIPGKNKKKPASLKTTGVALRSYAAIS